MGGTDAPAEIRFTRHARQKFAIMESYGFRVSEEDVVKAIQHPDRVNTRGEQRLAVRRLNSTYVLRVVYELRKDYLLVVTFYPLRRERLGL
jgi:hypothetical protein